MFDNLNMGDLGKMLNDVQQKAQELQNQNASVIYEAKSGGGMVSAKVNGKGELIDLAIDDSLLEDKESLQILLISAINEALTSAEKGKSQMAMNMFSGINPFGNKS